MASQFAFQAFGQSFLVTVAGATPTTTSVGVGAAVGSTTTLGITTGGYPAGGVRVANLGAATAFIQFGPSAAGVSANVTIGMAIIAQTVETFRIPGTPFLSCASAGTTTLNITPGEGM